MKRGEVDFKEVLTVRWEEDWVNFRESVDFAENCVTLLNLEVSVDRIVQRYVAEDPLSVRNL